MWIFSVASVAAADDFDYVKEVLEEDREHYGDQESYMHDYANAERNEEMKRETEQERIAKEEAERVRAEREKAFEAEVKRLSKEQQKEARKQKRKDAAIVRRVLQAAQREKHYEVLGLRNLELRVPSRSIKLSTFTLRIPGFSLLRVSTRQIKRAYRNMARAIHPDKNRDGRAVEAFHAVENAAATLLDPGARKKYDEMARARRLRLREERMRILYDITGTAIGITTRFVTVFRRVLGPFAFPITIIGALLI